MNGVTIAIIVLAVLSILLIGGAIAKAATSTVKEQQTEYVRPFAGYYGNNLVKFDGTPQISCPAGTSVNILGAWFEVYDPFLQCFPGGPTNDLIGTCKNPTGAYTQTCTSNVNSSLQNTTCLPPTGVPTPANAGAAAPGQTMCVRRDASAYLASVCDGKQSCPVPINESTFGPVPCATFSSGNLQALSSMSTLPFVPGNPGFTATKKGETPVPATYEQGYYVHGIYACR